MEALIFSSIAISLISPKKFATALPVITSYIFLSLSFSARLFCFLGFFCIILDTLFDFFLFNYPYLFRYGLKIQVFSIDSIYKGDM